MKHFFLLALLLIPLCSGAMPLDETGGFFPLLNDSAVQDTNRWEIWQDNIGRFVRPIGGARGGGFWPKHTGRNYLFGAGIWVGALDTTSRDTVVAWGYNPNSGRSGMGPCLPNGDTTGAGTDSLARVYRSDVLRDTAWWPERDSLGRPIIISDKELWAISSGLFTPLPDRSLGVVVVCRFLAWNSTGPWGDMVKMEFDVKNVTGRFQGRPRTLRKVILGLCVDADIGDESGLRGNDLCGLYLARNLAIQYQLPQEPGWGPPGPPYYLGLKFQETPKATDTVRVKDDRFPRTILPGQPLGVTAFKLYRLMTDPTTSGPRYLLLSGINYAYPPDTSNAYDVDDLGPGEKRFLASSGPFDLPNDSTVRLAVHIIAANDSLDLVRKADLVGVEDETKGRARTLLGFTLYPCTPNPASGSALIRYSLSGSAEVSLGIYDIAGRLWRELHKGERPPGHHLATWDGKDDSGKPVPSGVYLYRLKVGRSAKARGVVVLR